MTKTRLAAFRLAVLAASAALSAPAWAAPPTYHISDSIPGPDGRWDYARVDTANDQVLVAHGTSLTRIGLADKAVTAGLAPGLFLHDALPINGRELVVTDGGKGVVNFVDARSGATLATVTAGKNPDAAAYDPKTGLVLVMNHSGGNVTLIDARTHQTMGTVEVGGDLEAAAVDGAGHAFVNVEDKNEIAVVDLTSPRVTARYRLTGCEGPTGIAYDAPDRLLIAACDGDTAFVDAASGKVLQTLPTGGGADGVAWDAARRLAFVPAGHDGTLAVVAVARGKARIMQTLKTEVDARTLALDPRSGRVYLPSGRFAPAATPGARPTLVAGSFHVLVVSP